ncbi:MAG: GGDEF domain-containing protein [Mariprofundaceae bacterium]|nr:GGDEF domain-containing protein [Mariprofundaceae bacterium]
MIHEEHTQNCLMCQGMLQLMAQQSSHQLHLTLLTHIREMAWVSKVSGFEVANYKQGKAVALMAYADQTEHDIHEMAKHPDLLVCLEKKEMQRQTQGNVLFVPVQRAQAQCDVWVIESDAVMKTQDMDAILMLAKIFRHCDQHISAHKNDPLTGLENRQALAERLGRLLHVKSVGKRREDEHSWMPSLCVLDIDFFKRVNDNFGHLYGDEVLLLFAGLMKECFRNTDDLYRYGGEEFVVLLDTVSQEETEAVLERFRKMVDDFKFPQVGHITVSIGFVVLESGILPSSLFDHADKALYYAKEHGRNRVCSYQDLLNQGLIEQGKVQVDSEIF